MSLINRLTGKDAENKLPVHQFVGAISEYVDGAITEADLKTVFGIVDGDDLTEWEWLRNKYAASTDKPEFIRKTEHILLMAEKKLFGYNLKANIQTRINALA